MIAVDHTLSLSLSKNGIMEYIVRHRPDPRRNYLWSALYLGVHLLWNAEHFTFSQLSQNESFLLNNTIFT